MKQLSQILGYVAASLTVLAAILTPLVFLNLFARGIAATGVTVDPSITGMPVRYRIARGAWTAEVHQPFQRRWALERTDSYIQVTFGPAQAMPERVMDRFDLDGDGQTDVLLRFDVPRDARAPLFFDAAPLTSLTHSVNHAGQDNFARLILRSGDRIVVRIPLR